MEELWPSSLLWRLSHAAKITIEPLGFGEKWLKS
jgi:hypothetical protein